MTRKPAGARLLLDAARDRRVERVRDVLDHEPERSRDPSLPERSRHLVPSVSEARDRLLHAVRRRERHAGLAVHDARDRLQAHAGRHGDVGHRRAQRHLAHPPTSTPRPGRRSSSRRPPRRWNPSSRASVIVRPSRSTVIRSATRNTSGRLWLTMITDSPCSRDLLDQLEHHLRLAHAERGGRLVHDHDPAPPGDRTRDRDRLALPAREVVHRLLDGRDPDLESPDRVRRLTTHLLPVEEAEPGERRRQERFAAEEQVRGGVEVVGEREVLVDRLDPERARRAGAVDRRPPALRSRSSRRPVGGRRRGS